MADTPDDLQRKMAELEALRPSLGNAEEIADSLIAWITTPTWDESRAYLETHPALLDTQHDEVVDDLLSAG
ncbi:MAG: hypothetical protein HC911_16330 [Chloroflexaceae bacterium]|nr:hypothetical protein [Chloroflexaceae bacterium]